MIDKYKVIREIPFSYPNLLKIAIQVSVAMEQNIENFAVYSITEANLIYLNELINRFTNSLDDKLMKSFVSSLANDKKILRKSISNKLRSISVRAKSVYDASNPNLKALNTGEIGRYGDAEFGEIAKGITKIAVKEIEELSKEGLTIEYLENLDAMIDEYNEILSKIRDMKYERELATAKRHEIVAELYELLTKYCRYGKLLFEHESPSRYKKFIMHRSKNKHTTNDDEQESIDANPENG